jgi:hypothetical protein
VPLFNEQVALILIDLQSHDVVVALKIDDGCSPAFVPFGESERKFPVWRFIFDDFFIARFNRRNDQQNAERGDELHARISVVIGSSMGLYSLPIFLGRTSPPFWEHNIAVSRKCSARVYAQIALYLAEKQFGEIV